MVHKEGALVEFCHWSYLCPRVSRFTLLFHDNRQWRRHARVLDTWYKPITLYLIPGTRLCNAIWKISSLSPLTATRGPQVEGNLLVTRSTSNLTEWNFAGTFPGDHPHCVHFQSSLITTKSPHNPGKRPLLRNTGWFVVKHPTEIRQNDLPTTHANSTYGSDDTPENLYFNYLSSLDCFWKTWRWP